MAIFTCIFVYLLRCSDNSLYCGQTNDLKKRVFEHNNNKNKASKYTWAHRPVKLVYFEKCLDKTGALKREREIKRLSKIEKEKLVKSATIKI